MPDLTRMDFRSLLRKLTSRLHVLNLGTLDSFFVSIIRNFPFEFGLGGGFEVLDEYQGSMEKTRVYGQVFQRSRTRAREQKDFLEAFKLATFGSEESTLLRDLNRFVDGHHEAYLSAPSAVRWGNPHTIWPGGCPWLVDGHAFECDLVREGRALLDSFDTSQFNEKQINRWKDFVTEIATYSPGAPLPAAMKFILAKLLAAYDELIAGAATLTVFKKQKLTSLSCEILCRITRTIVGREVANKLRQTRGIWKVLDQYENAYSRLVRRRGRLTFYDLQLILGQSEGAEASRPMLTQRPGHPDRLRIDYRLDTRFDHWLLDEFQDTSYLQWSVIENLVDEAVQDTSGQRSLFQVGDLKQAIYAWRGGDVRLFNDIRDRYNQDEERIVERPLNDSWRSGPAVISMVNAVFGNDEMLRYLFPGEAVDRWRWGDHVSKHPDLGGYACFLQPSGGEARLSREEQNGRRFDLMLDVLREVDPSERGLSCAVLVQTNRAGQEVVDWVRAHSDIAITSESLVHIAQDNPVTSALLDLLQFAAHPGDMFAWHHLQMTPFAAAFAKDGLDADALLFAVLDEVNRSGFELVIASWHRRLLDVGAVLDPFSTRRLEELAVAARTFDATGSRSIPAFLQFARNYTIRESSGREVVQVMTIHKAKGLGFDVVILPDLGGNALTTIRKGLAVHRNDDRSVEWVMNLPQKDIARADERLDFYYSQREAEACYEGLCTLYVAMTRAKRAMYVIADKVPRYSRAANYPRMLEKTLGREGDDVAFGRSEALAIFQSGDRKWCQSVERGPKAADALREAPSSLPPSPTHPLRPRFPRKTPSGSESYSLKASQVFSRSGIVAREHGTAVHALFECIEWFDDSTLDTLRSFAASNSIDRRALEEVLACLAKDQVQEELKRPLGEAEVWLERRFETILDGSWLSGMFDRVVILPDQTARILDFKTDVFSSANPCEKELAGKAAIYRPQLDLYKRVLSRMAGISESRISCALLFTKLSRCVEV